MELTQNSLFGKMSRGHFPVMEGVTFKPCLKKSQRPIFQYLEVEDGQEPEWFEASSAESAGESLMLNFGASPNIARESFLSQVLENGGGLTEVLFEPESVRRDNPASEESGEATSASTGRSVDTASWGFGNGQVNGEYLEEKVGALNTMHDPKMIVTPTIVEVRQPKVKGQGGRSNDNRKQMHYSFHQ